MKFHLILKQITFGWALIACLAINSCSDALNMAPDGKTSLEEIFLDNDRIAAYLNSCYRYIPPLGNHWFFYMRGPVVWCDEAWDTDAEAEPGLYSGALYSGLVSASDHFSSTVFWGEEGNGESWVRFWAGIRQCTYFLTHIEDAPVTNTENKNRWTAEAHLLRAFYYSELLRWFGCPLPIEREVYPLSLDFSTVKRESYYEVVKFIIEDCDAALGSSALPWRITTNAEEYRLTKAVAEAIKSRMIVYAASPLYNDGNNYWEEAYQVSRTALTNLKEQGYQLYNAINFAQDWDSDETFLPNREAKLFNEYFCNTMAWSANPVDKETIYQTKSTTDFNFHMDGIGCQYGYKSGTCPSQELVDCFETTDGQPVLNLSRPYNDEATHLNPNFNTANTLYDEQNPYVNRDPRFYASIYYNGSQRRCFWQFDESVGCVENYPASAGYRTRIIATWDGEPQTGIHPTIRKATRTGYFIRKFLHPNVGSDRLMAESKPKAFRLGEALLNYAEAAAEAGHLAEAKVAVDEIRARVNMPPLPDGLSQADLILRVRNERRVELALEGFRYFDVRRWTHPDSDLEKTDRWITAIWITRNDDGTYTYRRGPVSRERLCYSRKFLWAPIPMNEANNMRALTGEVWQNPGW